MPYGFVDPSKILGLPLTRTQERIFDALADGKCTKEIAYERRSQLATVNQHIHRAAEKLGARTTWQALAIYVQEKLKRGA